MNDSDLTFPDNLYQITDASLRRAIGRLFADAQDAIDDGVTLVVLAARRLGCLYQVLLGQGMPPLRGALVVSDRYLYVHPDRNRAEDRNWSEDRVLLLDDSVIVGTTLHTIREKLLRLGVKDMQCRSVCVDDDQVVTFLSGAIHLEPVEHTNTQRMNEFSRQLVTTLFQNQVPYFSDFPVMRALNIDHAAWQAILCAPGWLAVDVTDPVVGGPRSFSVTLLPTNQTRQALLERIPAVLRGLVEVCKVRTFIGTHDGGLRVVVVPLATVRPVNGTRLREAISSLHVLGNTDLDCGDWSAVAQHRLLQFIVSTYLLAATWPMFESAPLERAHLDTLPLELTFGDRVGPVLDGFDAILSGEVRWPDHQVDDALDMPRPSPLLDHDEVREALWATQQVLWSLNAGSGKPDADRMGKLGAAYAHAVSAVFGVVHDRLEMPQRAEIRKCGSVEEYVNRLAHRRILRQVLTIRELAELLLPSLADGGWTRDVMMLGIDAGNDLGAVVPVTRHDRLRDVVYRAYRFGETAYLVTRPLAGAGGQRDEWTMAAINAGRSLTGSTYDVASWDAPPRTSLESQIEAVPLVHEQIVFGGQGPITFVGETTFGANLEDPINGAFHEAEIRLDALPPKQRAQLRPHRSVSWLVTEREVAGGLSRSSIVRLHDDPPVGVARP